MLFSRVASRVELNQHDLSQKLIRINFRNKCLSHELIRLNFPKTSLSQELSRLNYLKTKLDSNQENFESDTSLFITTIITFIVHCTTRLAEYRVLCQVVCQNMQRENRDAEPYKIGAAPVPPPAPGNQMYLPATCRPSGTDAESHKFVTAQAPTPAQRNYPGFGPGSEKLPRLRPRLRETTPASAPAQRNYPGFGPGSKQNVPAAPAPDKMCRLRLRLRIQLVQTADPPLLGAPSLIRKQPLTPDT